MCCVVLKCFLCIDHDDAIKWKHFPRYWPFVRGINRSPVNSPHKGQWRGALMISFICTWFNGWVNNREGGDLRRHRTHYDVTVMVTYDTSLVGRDPLWKIQVDLKLAIKGFILWAVSEGNTRGLPWPINLSQRWFWLTHCALDRDTTIIRAKFCKWNCKASFWNGRHSCYLR